MTETKMCDECNRGTCTKEIKYYSNGIICSVLHRTTDLDGNMIPHREGDLPAKIYYHPNGHKWIETYFNHGKTHRTDSKPTTVQYDKDGQFIHESYV